MIVFACSPFCDAPWQGKANDSYTSAPTQCVVNKVFIAQAGAPVVAALTRRDDNSGAARQHAVHCRSRRMPPTRCPLRRLRRGLKFQFFHRGHPSYHHSHVPHKRKLRSHRSSRLVPLSEIVQTQLSVQSKVWSRIVGTACRLVV